MDDNTQILDDFTLEVKKIEEKADEILLKAQEDKTKSINDAKSDSVALILKKQKSLEEKNDDLISTEKQKIDKIKDANLKKGQEDLKEFEKISKKNISKATDLVLKELQKKIEGY